MGRKVPCSTMQPNQTRRAERATRAKETINRAIPEMLRSCPRARHGLHKAERIVDPPSSSTAQSNAAPGKTHLKIRLCCSDTLSAAAALSSRISTQQSNASTQQRSNVAILNFASPLRPGGGFLDGANSQEEFLCARTTLYPSLWDSFYRLPEFGGIFTPDVLVFRDSTPLAVELRKNERFFVDVISAGMLRFPDIDRPTNDEEEGGCSCGVSYCDRDRELVTNKMRAVMRVAESKGCKTLVLGAWGCGAYGNPVAEVAKIWRKVIAGGPRQRKPLTETWSGISEIVFAVPDRSMLYEFEQAFEGLTSHEPVVAASDPSGSAQAPHSRQGSTESELLATIMRTEAQLQQTYNFTAKARLRDVLARLYANLEKEDSARLAQSTDLTQQEDEEQLEDIISSDPEASNLYNFDEDDVASDSSDGEHSEIYDFSTSKVGDVDKKKNDEEYSASEPSPNFDDKTGWFNGSMDELSRMLKLSAPGEDVATPGSPDEGCTFNEQAIDAYLSKYGGTDARSTGSSVL